jgi:hypothetical protein
MMNETTNELEALELKYGPAVAQYIWDEIEQAQNRNNVVSPDFSPVFNVENKYRQAA